MKHIILTITTCIAFLTSTPVLCAEELEEFLKRSAVGNTTKDEFNADFYALIFIAGKASKFNRDQLIQLHNQQKAMGAQSVINNFTIISKTETPISDGKATIISVIAKAVITTNIGSSKIISEPIAHDVLIRNKNGKFLILFSSTEQ
jgi:hypothetical protein